MKVVILAGGYGTRITEESYLRPKPMIEIGDYPILWHIMKIYAHFGYTEFIICLGYKSYIIKEYFAEYYLRTSDVTFDLAKNTMKTHNNQTEPWMVTLVDTGLDTMTGGRLLRVRQHIGNEPFLLTYGDGVADVDINKIAEFHKSHGKLMTITSTPVLPRFGLMDITSEGLIAEFKEKSEKDATMVNAGFMVLNPEIFDYIDGDSTFLEREPMSNIARDGQLMAFEHRGFWQCMDTARDKEKLDKLWQSGNPPWKVW